MAKAASGTVVSDDVAMEAPVDAPPRPLLVSELSARFCAAVAGASDTLAVVAVLVVAAAVLLTVPAVPEALGDVKALEVTAEVVVGEMIGAVVVADALALVVATA